jgi:hypothetical protein
MPISPTAEGFRATFRRPSLALGEITWRWVTGVTATVLFFFGLYQYLDSLPVNNGELLFLRSRQPYLVSQALAHILRGSLSRVVLSGLLAALLLGLLWMVAGAVGRIATVRTLLEYFRKDVAGPVATNSFRALMRLNFLRAIVAVAALVGLLGAAILAGFVSPDNDPRPGLAFLLFFPLAGLVWLAWLALNWLLSLAGMFAVRDGDDTMGAIAAAVGFCRERTGAVAAVSVWTGLAHLIAFVGMTTIISMPVGFAAVLPGRLVVLVMTLIAMTYFAVADWLYMARLAGYVCIVETPEAVLKPPLRSMPPPIPLSPVQPSAKVQPIALPTLQVAIDRDELILSDMPIAQTSRSVDLKSTIDRDEVILSDVPNPDPPDPTSSY